MKACCCKVGLLLLLWILRSPSVVAIDSVRVAKSCFQLKEPIDATFSITKPRNGDWVGLTPSTSNLLGAVKYDEFLYTCGTPSCIGSLASGTVTFLNNVPAGSYVAVLLPNNTFIPLAVTSPFLVNATCPTPVAPTRPTMISPTVKPVVSPTVTPAANPTVKPVANPTVKPVANSPSQRPTPSPTQRPVVNPTPRPNSSPTQRPTPSPTQRPTPSPSQRPVVNPTQRPNSSATQRPTPSPTQRPTPSPTQRTNSSAITQRPTPSPTQRSNSSATQRPTPSPTQQPTPSPTLARPSVLAPVVPKPTVPSNSTSRPINGSAIDLVAAKVALQQASVLITAMVKKDRFLLQQYLRLLFHDCHIICDGCVDVSNRDNGLLDLPIFGLNPIVQQFATPETGLSRADIWVLAMVIALNNANQQPTLNPVTFEMNWIGRKDCEKRNTSAVCTDTQGRQIPCAVSGPKRSIASVNMNSLDFASFWRTNFNNITLRQAVALMGCHTVGRFFTQVSGIDGPNGWVVDNISFNNEYFQALLGSRAIPNMTFAELLTVAPVWQRTVQTNQNTTLPVRHFWTLTTAGKKLVMTNADVSFVRQLNSSNMNASTGEVSCGFAAARRGPPVCPGIDTIKFAEEFLDNDTWLTTVKEALDLMTTNGYQRGPCSAGQLCVLQDL